MQRKLCHRDSDLHLGMGGNNDGISLGIKHFRERELKGLSLWRQNLYCIACLKMIPLLYNILPPLFVIAFYNAYENRIRS
mgnify:CR=1 FL=1